MIKPRMTYEDRYTQGYMEGYRIGRICRTRELLIKMLLKEWKENGILPIKSIIRQINRETDIGFMDKIFFSILFDEISIQELETSFDEIFRTDDEIHNEKFTVYLRKNENE